MSTVPEISSRIFPTLPESSSRIFPMLSTVSVRMCPTFSDSSFRILSMLSDSSCRALLFSSEIFPSKRSKSFDETSEVVSCLEKALTITMTVQTVQTATNAKMMYMNVFIKGFGLD